jgi:cobalt-zinc-cadmium efflux system outer membrane protein
MVMANSLWVKASFIIHAVLLLVLSPVFGAEPMRLTLEQAVQITLARNLELKAKREDLGLAEARLIRANLLFQHNPELEGDVSNRRLNKPEDGSRNVLQGGVFLSQEFEIGGQPIYRRQAAQRNYEKVKFEVADFERTLRFRVTELFLRLVNNQAKVKQAEQIVDLRSRLYEASGTRLRLGDIPEVQHTLSEFELNRARSDLIGLQRDREELLAKVRTDLGLEPDALVEVLDELKPAPTALSPAELVKMALERRADLAALEREKGVTEAEEKLTRAERIPNVKAGPFYERDDRDNIIGGRISIPLPIFDRKQAELREALARKSAVNINYLNLRQNIERSVRAAYTRLKLSEQEISLYPEASMRRFDETLELYLKAYQERQIDLSELLLFQNQVIEARQKFIDAMTNYNLSLAELKLQAGIE